jgi:hypothetical protein
LTDAIQEELLIKIFNLLKGLEDKDNGVESSPEKKRLKRKARFFVQGGLIRQRDCEPRSLNVLYIDREYGDQVKVLDKQNWLAIPVITATAEGILSMKSLTEIKVNYSGFASGAIVGASAASTEWLIDYIDSDNKVLGAHYAISIAGLGFGGGRGYQLVKLKEGEIKQEALAVADSKTTPEPKKVAPPAITTEPPRIIPPALFANVAFYGNSSNRILRREEAV